ncbi:MAG: hypothetical protein JO064_06110 [Actinobacteria bacterium]|nr:hypothetical protein [Actinomycetota bacterium]
MRLAREGGIGLGEPAQDPPPRGWEIDGVHGSARPRRWDVVTAVDVPELDAEHAIFVALSRDERVAEEGPPGADVGPLAAAVERELDPPYRAEAVRRHGTLWAVAARSITVVALPGVAGHELELSVRDGARSLLVDGEPSFGSIPALERPDHVARARRIAGDRWEVRIDPL